MSLSPFSARIQQIVEEIARVQDEIEKLQVKITKATEKEKEQLMDEKLLLLNEKVQLRDEKLLLLKQSQVSNIPLHLTVRLWDAVDGCSVEAVLRNVTSFADLQSRIPQQFPSLVQAQQNNLLQLYYMREPHPQHRQYVNNDNDLRAFADAVLQLEPKCKCLIGFVRPQDGVSPRPDHFPQHLRVQTRLTDSSTGDAYGNGSAASAGSGRHSRLSAPTSASSPSSPKDEQGRSKLLKKLCIHRDRESDFSQILCPLCDKKGVVTYEGASQSSTPFYGDYGDVAHIVSFRAGDRDGIDVPACLLNLASIGAGGMHGVDVLYNVLYLCKSCHSFFGAGKLWLKVVLDNSGVVDHLLLSASDDVTPDDLNGKKIYRGPIDSDKRKLFPFDPPYNAVWAWHEKWAEKRRSKRSCKVSPTSTSTLEQQLESISLSPPLPPNQ